MNAEAILAILRQHEPELRALGVTHAAIFGSTARGEENDASDIDIVIDVEEALDAFRYAGLKRQISGLLPGKADIVARRYLLERIRPNIERDQIHAF